jgi:hypothetical protein
LQKVRPEQAAREAAFSLENSMAGEADPQRGDYSVRDAFLEDLRIAREMKTLRNSAAFWDFVEDLAVKNTDLAARLDAAEARITALEETLTTGQQ